MTITEIAIGLSSEAQMSPGDFTIMMGSSYDGLTPAERKGEVNPELRDEFVDKIDPKAIQAALFTLSMSTTLHFYFDNEWANVPFGD